MCAHCVVVTMVARLHRLLQMHGGGAQALLLLLLPRGLLLPL